MVDKSLNTNCTAHDEFSHHGAFHQHHHVNRVDTRGIRLLITLALNLVIPVTQVIGGLYAHSMALISDATHNLSDFTAILVAYVAYRISRKGASIRNTFGYQRVEIMAALVNVMILLAASVFIVYEAAGRLYNPQPVAGGIVMLIAAVGVIGNGFSAWLLHRDSKHSLNMRGAFLHMVGDFLTSVVVLLTGLFLLFKPWYWLDPLLSLAIVIFIVKNCWSIMKEASAVLMNAVPRGLDLQAVKDFLESLEAVKGVHYIHAWNLSSSSIAFTCHIVVPDQPVSQTEKLMQEIASELRHRFGIDHPILQFETRECGKGTLLCEMSCGGD